MPKNTDLLELLEKINIVHEKKADDYSSEGFYANFEEAANLVKLFKDPTHQVFAALIGVKWSRIANLLNKGVEPNNESVADSFLDVTTYSALFASYIKSKNTSISI